MNEIWKDVQGYEGRYLISNTGKLKSYINNKEKLIKGHINPKGYLQYSLSWKLKNKVNNYSAHQLIAQAFLGHKICGHELVVDHINDNPSDNRIENLQIVTTRFNTRKTQGKYSSQYKGVYLHRGKWKTQILIKEKLKFLGYFTTEHEAHLAYQNALNNFEL